MQVQERDALFIQEQLEQILGNEDLIRYNSLSRGLFSIATDVSEWAEAVSSFSRTSYGEAEMIAYKSLLPVIGSFRSRKVTHPIVALGGAAEYDVQEVVQAQAQGTNLNALEVQTLTDSVYRKEDRLVFRGDSNSGVYGVGNHPLITQVQLTADGNQNGFTNTTSWLGKTIQQICTEMAEILRVQGEAAEASNAPQVDTMILPSTVAAYLLSTFTQVGGSVTMMTILRQTFPNIQFTQAAAMNSLPIGSQNNAMNSAALLYNRASGIQVVIPRDVRFEPVQATDLKFRIPAHSRFGGVRVNFPESTLLLVGL